MDPVATMPGRSRRTLMGALICCRIRFGFRDAQLRMIDHILVLRIESPALSSRLEVRCSMRLNQEVLGAVMFEGFCDG